MKKHNALLKSSIHGFYALLEKDGTKISSMYSDGYLKELFLMDDCFFEITKLKMGEALKEITELSDPGTIDKYIEHKARMQEIEKEPEIIPVLCPFTNIVVYDAEGYHEPYPETLVATNSLDELYFYRGFEIIEEYHRFIEENLDFLVETFEKDKHMEEFCYLKLPWFDWNEIIEGFYRADSFLEWHSQVWREEDSTDYGHPFVDGPYYFYFCKIELQQVVLKDFKAVVDVLKEIVILKK